MYQSRRRLRHIIVHVSMTSAVCLDKPFLIVCRVESENQDQLEDHACSKLTGMAVQCLLAAHRLQLPQAGGDLQAHTKVLSAPFRKFVHTQQHQSNCLEHQDYPQSEGLNTTLTSVGSPQGNIGGKRML